MAVMFKLRSDHAVLAFFEKIVLSLWLKVVSCAIFDGR